MTRDEISSLPAVLDIMTAAQVLGVGRSAAYELVRSGAWPSPVIRLGSLIRIPTAPLLALVGVTYGGSADAEPVGV
jgi:excisionase family DNA binding protein